MARLRACELVDAKGKSLLPTAPQGEALKKLIIGRGNMTHYIEDRNIPQLTEKFKTLRAEANAWHAQRTEYMMERLKAGRHPDTDNSFWNEWREPTAPSLYGSSEEDKVYKFLTIGLTSTLCQFSRAVVCQETQNSRELKFPAGPTLNWQSPLSWTIAPNA